MKTEEKKYLKVDENEPLLKIDNQTFLEDGTIFEYSIAYFKTSKYKFIQKAQRAKM